MVMGYKNGVMEIYMKVSGNSINLMERERFDMPMAILIKETGSMIKQLDMEFTTIQTEANIKAFGKMINFMEKA